MSLLHSGDDVVNNESPIVRGIHKKVSVREAYFQLIKASIGPGCLSLPYAMTYTGLVPGIVLLVVATVVIGFNMSTLVSLRRKYDLLAEVVGDPAVRTFGDVGFVCMGRSGQYFSIVHSWAF